MTAPIINVLRKEYPELFDEELKEKVLYEAGQAVKYECEIIEWIVNGYGHETLNTPLLTNFLIIFNLASFSKYSETLLRFLVNGFTM